MRTRKHIFLSLGLLCLLCMAVLINNPFDVLFNSNTSEFNGITTYAEQTAGLQRMLADLPAASAEAQTIRAALHRIAAKQSKTRLKAENPAVLIEALAEIKTRGDGLTYPRGHRINERAKALARKSNSDVTSGELLPWIERGPGNVSGRARALVVDVADPSGNSWFIASVGGGIWKTSDAGQNWINLTQDLPNLSTSSLEQSQSDPNILYAGTGMGYGRVVDLEGSGIWKSIDGGQTWNQLTSTADGQLFSAINRIVVDPNDPDILLVCGNDSYAHLYARGFRPKTSGIFKSDDGGQSWRQVFTPTELLPQTTDNRVQQIIADPVDFNKLYAAVNEVGVIMSRDAGESWEISADNFALPSDIGVPTSGGFGLAGISVRTELAISPSNPNRLYAAVERPRGIADLYMSTDAGESWVLLPDTGNDPNWFNANGQSGAGGAYTAGWFDNTLNVHPFNPDIVFVGGVNIYRINVDPLNQNRSAVPITWWIPNNFQIPVVHADQHDLVMIADAATQSFRIAVANDGGVGYSADGGTNWVQLTGMGTTQFYGADKKPGEDVYIGGMQDNGSYRSPPNSTAESAWSNAGGGDGFQVAWNKRDPNLVLTTAQFNIINRSTDGGQIFSGFNLSPGVGSSFITKLAQTRKDPDLLFAINSNGILRSDDFGLTWTQTTLLSNWLGYRPFCNVEVSDADARVVWASSKFSIDPPVNRSGGLHVSTNGGAVFSDISALVPEEFTEASGMATHPSEAGTAYLLFAAPQQAKILRTTNFGANWEDISGFVNGVSTRGFPDVAVFDLLVMPFNPQVMWAATEIGLFLTDDGGQSWEYSDNGIPHVSIFQLRIVDNQVIAATYGRGIWSTELEELNGFTEPDQTLMPQLSKLAVMPNGMLHVAVTQRSAYDSTRIYRNGIRITTLAANSEPATTSFDSPITEEGIVNVYVEAFVDGQMYRSPNRQVFMWQPQEIVTYSTDLSDSSDTADYRMFGWSVQTPAGFADRAFHSLHPYPNGSNMLLLPRYAVRVAQDNALLEFDEVVLVEEGLVDDWTNAQFFDFVVVEGSIDGCNWLPLLPGYDSRAYTGASAAYQSGLNTGGNSSTPGNLSLFERRVIDLHDTFKAADLILLRFRLVTDAAANAWGWAIDNISIQANPTDVATADKLGAPTAQIVSITPHPIRAAEASKARLYIQNTRAGHVEVELLDVRGNVVMNIFRGHLDIGLNELPFLKSAQALNKAAGGLHLVRLQTEESRDVQTIIIIP